VPPAGRREIAEVRIHAQRQVGEIPQPRQTLCLSPQCGFSSTVDGNALSYEQEVAKLERIVETAAEVWG
jgi:hypothetical protein